MKLNMFEVIFAICLTVQNVSEPLLILTERSIMAYIAIILSENNLSDIIIEEIVCRNTCVECNYNIWITFYIFLWNYESIKVGVQLVFNTIWEWHRFTAVIWKNDTKSFIFSKLKMISVHNFEDNTSVVHILLDVMFFCRHKKWRPFCSKWVPFFHKIPQTRNLFQDNLINFFINIINITEKNGYVGLYQWPLICFSILLRNNCHNGGHFENKMAAIALKFVA